MPAVSARGLEIVSRVAETRPAERTSTRPVAGRKIQMARPDQWACDSANSKPAVARSAVTRTARSVLKHGRHEVSATGHEAEIDADLGGPSHARVTACPAVRTAAATDLSSDVHPDVDPTIPSNGKCNRAKDGPTNDVRNRGQIAQSSWIHRTRNKVCPIQIDARYVFQWVSSNETPKGAIIVSSAEIIEARFRNVASPGEAKRISYCRARANGRCIRCEDRGFSILFVPVSLDNPSAIVGHRCYAVQMVAVVIVCRFAGLAHIEQRERLVNVCSIGILARDRRGDSVHRFVLAHHLARVRAVLNWTRHADENCSRRSAGSGVADDFGSLATERVIRNRSDSHWRRWRPTRGTG